MNDLIISREAAAHRGRRLEYFTIAWNSLEGPIGIGAGTIAGSISLVGFGINSLIETAEAAVYGGGFRLRIREAAGRGAADSYVSDPAKPVPYLPRPVRFGDSDRWKQWLVTD
jgi:hypothetical protein